MLAHSDVAPERKQDPGELFDWRRLARAGIGLWPADGAGVARSVAPMSRSVAQVQRELARFGYQVAPNGALDAPSRAVIAAFQRHFRPERVDGEPDPGTLARLDGLLALLALQEG